MVFLSRVENGWSKTGRCCNNCDGKYRDRVDLSGDGCSHSVDSECAFPSRNKFDEVMALSGIGMLNFALGIWRTDFASHEEGAISVMPDKGRS